MKVENVTASFSASVTAVTAVDDVDPETRLPVIVKRADRTTPFPASKELGALLRVVNERRRQKIAVEPFLDGHER